MENSWICFSYTALMIRRGGGNELHRSDPVRLFWYQDFSEVELEIQAVMCGTSKWCSQFGLNRDFSQLLRILSQRHPYHRMYYSVVEDAASSLKYVRSGRKFKINPYFG